MVTETFGDEADDVLAEYPATDYDSPALALATVLTDWGGQIGACPVLRTAEAAAATSRSTPTSSPRTAARHPAGSPWAPTTAWTCPTCGS